MKSTFHSLYVILNVDMDGFDAFRRCHADFSFIPTCDFISSFVSNMAVQVKPIGNIKSVRTRTTFNFSLGMSVRNHVSPYVGILEGGHEM